MKAFLNQVSSKRCFRRESLVGSIFDKTVFSGVIFTAANLEDSSFQECRFGYHWFWKFILLLLQVFLLIVAGAVIGAGGLISTGLMRESSTYGALVFLSLVFSSFLMVWRGLLFGAIAGICSLVPFLLLSVVLPSKEHGLDINLPFFVGSGAIALNTFGIGVAVLAIALSMTLFESIPLAVGVVLLSTFIIAALIAQIFKLLLIVPVVTITVLIAAYLGLHTITGDPRFQWITQIVIILVTKGGNLFIGTNLTGANFTSAILRFCDFRNANLTRTRFCKVKGLEFARLGDTYLANPKIQQLVVTCNGQGQNFDGLDLTGVNLQDARLQDASFIGASLNQSNLRGADLSRAILKQTQLEGTDLTGAILTGAYIEDWGITSTTKLENVQCEYVYMRVPTKENPNPLRKPDNLRQTFAEGEFADFIQPFFDTLDLYHSQDVDPRAISIALRNLSAKHPDDELQFVAMERRGNQGLNLRFTTAHRANKSELSHEYFASYAQIRGELPIAVQMQLVEQDTEIRTLKGTIEQFIQTSTHQSTIRAETIQVIQGELVMTETRDIKISAGDNANISRLVSGDGIVNLGTIGGNVTNAINQLPDPSELEQPNLKALLTQLQQAIQTDANLPDPDKSDLLEQVQALAEAKQTEEPAKREGITRKAMKIFDATLKSLPDAAKIVEACSKLLPLILKALGLPL